jgi:hypothetical protein
MGVQGWWMTQTRGFLAYAVKYGTADRVLKTRQLESVRGGPYGA